MSRSLRGLTAPLIKSLIFIVVTVLATSTLLATITNQAGGGSAADLPRRVHRRHRAQHRRRRPHGRRAHRHRHRHRRGRTGAGRGDASRSPSDVHLASTVHASDPLPQPRRAALHRTGPGRRIARQTWPSSRTLGLDRTTPALDLTALFNGFQPLFSALDPKQINALSYEIIQIFQGQGGTVERSRRPHRVADQRARRSRPRHRCGDRQPQHRAEDGERATQPACRRSWSRCSSWSAASPRTVARSGRRVTSLGGLTTSVAGLLRAGRPALQQSIVSLGQLSKNLADNGPTVDTCPADVADQARPDRAARVLRLVGQQLPLLDHRTHPRPRRLLRRRRCATGRSEVPELMAIALVQRTQPGDDRGGRAASRPSRSCSPRSTGRSCRS